MVAQSRKFQAVKGMADIMPPETKLWQDVESAARRVFESYGMSEVRTPIAEQAELFRRGVGESTSIVEKEMYVFEDRGGDLLALRPEGTASVVRAYIESGAGQSEPVAGYYYMGPMFRRERPQKGRQRQFHQIGCEILGYESPLADADVIAMFAHLLRELGIGGISLELNSLGCSQCRPSFNDALESFLAKRADGLCDDCRRRMGRNPMRVLDCKNEACRGLLGGAPRLPDYWCNPCKEHFGSVRKALGAMGIEHELKPGIVRGLDYYMRTAFEFIAGSLGAQNAVAAGGRYDGLVKALGGPDIPGVGCALGIERLVILMGKREEAGPPVHPVFFAIMGDQAAAAALPAIQTLRSDGVRVEWDYSMRSLKAQMRRANKIGAGTVVIVGDDEVAKGHATVRDMHTGAQHEVRIADLPRHFVRVSEES
jgi:histidyl-tRNA synthetase